MTETLRERLESVFAGLKDDRASWEGPWRDICEQMSPYRAVWGKEERNRGERKDGKIINNTPVRALSRAAAGMQAGVTNPARDWFGLVIEDKDLLEFQPVKIWLNDVRRIIAVSLSQSTFYKALSNGGYPDILAGGTGCILHEEPVPGRAHFRPVGIGRYWLDMDSEDKIDTIFRELWLTTRQMVQKFGEANLPPQVIDAYERHKMNKPWEVRHAILPNAEFVRGMIGKHGKRWASVWWTPTDERENGLLNEGGYDLFPGLCPRWSVEDGGVYGRGPGWEARGDCRELQHHERRSMQMIDKIVDPPMKGSPEIKRGSLLPGDFTSVGRDVGGVFEPAMEVPPQALPATMARTEQIEYRIKDTFFNDLLRMLLDDDRTKTATEVERLREEGMLQLGPLLQNLDDELLRPTIERQFTMLEETGQLPEPPDELDGHEVQIKFISILHQMQQATGLGAIRTLVQEVMQLSQIKPDVVDKINADKAVDELGRITGVRPDIVLSDEDVNAARAERAKMEAAQQQGDAMLKATEGIRNVSGADPQQLSDLVQQLSPAAAAQGGALGES